MRSTIFYFSTDSDHGMYTRLYMSRESLAQAIHASVESYDSEKATAMRAISFGSDEWQYLWCEHMEEQEQRDNYFHYGFEELEVSPGQSTNEPEKQPVSNSYDLMEVPTP